MLIVTRRIGESVMIGDEVTLKVVGVRGRHVRVGIAAPKSIAVHRAEVHERGKSEHVEPGAGEPGR